MNRLVVIEREVTNTANEIDQMFRQRHSMKELEHTLMRLINRTQANERTGLTTLVTTHTPTTDHPGSKTTVEKSHHKFTPEEIEGFLTFLLEGGADKQCSNVYLIIAQLRDDLTRLEGFRTALCGNMAWAHELVAKAHKLTTEKFDQELNRSLPITTKREAQP